MGRADELSREWDEVLRRAGALGPPITIRLEGTYDDLRRPPPGWDLRSDFAQCPYCAALPARIDDDNVTATYTCDAGHDYIGPPVFLLLEEPDEQFRLPHVTLRAAA